MRLSILPLALLAAGAPLAAAETHPFNIRDLVMMDRLSDLQVSPDGQWVAFVVRKTDFDANRGRTDVWLMPTAGGEARQLTRHEAGDDSPRWAADGKSLYFLSRRSGSSQIWRLPLTGGEAEQITKLPLDVSNLLLSPDGKYLAFSLEVFIDCADLACTQDRLSKAESAKETGRIYDRLFLRHWDSWEDGRRQHLFVLPVAGGTPLDLTRGLDADVPSMPFGGVEEWAFTPDGREMLFSARVAGASEPWSTNFDLYAVPVDGSAAPRNLTAGNPAWDTRPMFTPDGRSLVYLAMSRPGFEADRFRILIQPWPQGPAREVAPGWDRSPDQLVFSADGKTLYATANDLGRSALFALDVASGTSKRLVTDGSVHELARVGSDLLVLRDHLKGPNEIYRLGPDGSGFRALTSFNGERLAGLRMGEPEPFSFTGAKGETVHAWLIKPVDFDPGRKYPLAYLIHGGPQGSFKNEFHYRWNPQTYAGRGYAAVMVDFHGSTGYGQAFTDSIS
nr:prolyl oligopeptidase family serine peptidase [Thermoanaerobaculia bacterium]